MVLLREVAQGIGQGELLLLGREDVLPDRGVRHVRVALTWLRAGRQQTFGQGGLEVGQGQWAWRWCSSQRPWDCGCVLSPCRIRRDGVCIRWCSNRPRLRWYCSVKTRNPPEMCTCRRVQWESSAARSTTERYAPRAAQVRRWRAGQLGNAAEQFVGDGVGGRGEGVDWSVVLEDLDR